MSRSRKILLGIISFLPVVLFGIYILYFLSFFFEMVRHQQDFNSPEGAFAGFYPIITFGILMGLTSVALLIYYIIHAVNNKKIDSTERIIWILVFLFAGMIGYPVYWYMRIWKDTDMSQPTAMAWENWQLAIGNGQNAASQFRSEIQLSILLPNHRQMNNRFYTFLHILNAHIFLLAMKGHLASKKIGRW